MNIWAPTVYTIPTTWTLLFQTKPSALTLNYYLDPLGEFSDKVQIVVIVLPANSELLLALGGTTWVGSGVLGLWVWGLVRGVC